MSSSSNELIQKQEGPESTSRKGTDELELAYESDQVMEGPGPEKTFLNSNIGPIRAHTGAYGGSMGPAGSSGVSVVTASAEARAPV